MRLRRFLAAVGLDELRDLAGGVFPDDPIAQLQDKAEHLRARLRRRQARLVACRRAIEAKKLAIGDGGLPISGRESSFGNLRFSSSPLNHQQRLYDKHLARLGQLKQRLRRLQEKIYRLRLDRNTV